MHCVRLAVEEATRVRNLADLGLDRGDTDIVDAEDNIIGRAPAPIALASDSAPSYRGKDFQTLPAGHDPVLRHIRTRIKPPQTNGVIERFFGTLKYEHLFRGYIGDGDALDMEPHRSRIIYNTIRPPPRPGRPHTPNRPTSTPRACQLLDSRHQATRPGS